MAWSTDTFGRVDQITGTPYRISVGRPLRDDPTTPTPLIVCMDGQWTFGTVLDATRIMSMGGEAPEAVVVGVAFDEDSMSEFLRQRARWFTPSPFVPPEVVGVKGVDAEECGQAQVLQDFLRDQLLPEVSSWGPVGERWIVGHSFSALFALRVLLTESELFDKYLLASPSIWWDDRMILGLEAEQARTGEPLSADVFVTAGADEQARPFAMVHDALELVDRLRAREQPGLRVDSAILPGDSHSNCIGAAVSKGLRAMTGRA